ncbi:glycosyltransferase [Bacteroidia bacterium]|nr:glycosyltransferase [Bacteroidia bacterium]
MLEFLSIDKLVLLSTACLSLIILLFYYFYFFTGFSKIEKESSSLSSGPVSVIIAARNEKNNLEKFLPEILNQEYPNFEVVLVNDGSHDGTKDFLKTLAENEPRLKVVTLEIDERFQRGKKFALTMGIKAASNECLLFTDADCYPTSPNWINAMASSFQDKSIVLGYGPLTVKNNMLGSIINYETFHTALQYIGYANRGKTYMGVGRNLAYTKTLFFDNKGFASHQHIMSGDDDLFIQEVATKDNVSICIDSQSYMTSQASTSIGDWIKQKIRHLSTGKEYKTSNKGLLGLYSIAQLIWYISLVLFTILFSHCWYISLGLAVFKWLLQWIVMYRPALLLNSKKVAYILPYYDILYTLFLFFFGITKLFVKPKTWS